jgi:hypothetical protein
MRRETLQPAASPLPWCVAENLTAARSVGLAWMFAPNWDLFVEYDHIWLGTKTLHFTDSASFFFDESIKQDLNQLVAGVDYRFTWRR